MADPVKGLPNHVIGGEDGGRFSEFLVTGRAAAPHIVVVECRKIVVNERGAVKYLQSRRGLRKIRGISSEVSTDGEGKKRPDALTGRENSVADSF